MLASAATEPGPKLAILSNYSEARITDLERSGDADAVAHWTSALQETLDRLSALDIPVLLVHDIPLLGQLPEPCRFGTVAALRCSVSTSSAIADQTRGRMSEVTAAAGRSGVHLVSLSDAFCSASVCTPIQREQLMYADNQHLDKAGSLYVAPVLGDAMRSATHN